jgi:hypothetical protein
MNHAVLLLLNVGLPSMNNPRDFSGPLKVSIAGSIG